MAGVLFSFLENGQFFDGSRFDFSHRALYRLRNVNQANLLSNIEVLSTEGNTSRLSLFTLDERHDKVHAIPPLFRAIKRFLQNGVADSSRSYHRLAECVTLLSLFLIVFIIRVYVRTYTLRTS